MECLDELSLGVRGQNLGKDMECPPVTSPATTDHMALLLDIPQALFDVPWHTLIYHSPAERWEQV